MSCVSYDPLVPARFILGTEQEPIPSHPSQKKSIFQIKLIRFESKLRMHPVLLRILWFAVRPQFLGFEPPLTPHEQAETVLCVVLSRQDIQIQKHSRTPANRTLRQADTGQSAVWLWVLLFLKAGHKWIGLKLFMCEHVYYGSIVFKFKKCVPKAFYPGPMGIQFYEK